MFKIIYFIFEQHEKKINPQQMNDDFFFVTDFVLLE